MRRIVGDQVTTIAGDGVAGHADGPALQARFFGLEGIDVTPDGTVAYITYRLQTAGADRGIFTDEALETIHVMSQGNPRQINRLCDLALLIGYAEEQPQIEAAAIEGVAQELAAVTSD